MHTLETNDQFQSKANEIVAFTNKFTIIPNLMPDELLLGFFGRFGLMNGYPDYEYAKSQVKNIFVNNFRKDYQYPLIYQMSDLLNTPVSQIVRENTLIPILRSLNWHGLQNDHINLAKSLGYKLAKDNVAFCKICIQEDDSLGESYWRRSHQVHGVFLCNKHNSMLYVAEEKNAFYSTPLEVYESSKISQPNLPLEILENTIIKKYIALLEDYLLTQNCLNIDALMKLIVNASNQLNLRRSEVGKRPLVSDFIYENVPHQWLVLHFPEFIKKKKNVYLNSFDGLFRSNQHPGSLPNLLLSISVLIPEADSSIFKIDNEPVSANKILKPVREDKNVLINYYFNNNGNYTKIGELLNLKKKSLRNQLIKLNLPALGYLNAETRKAIFDFYSDGQLLEILSRSNVNVDKFTRVLRESSAINKMKV